MTNASCGPPAAQKAPAAASWGAPQLPMPDQQDALRTIHQLAGHQSLGAIAAAVEERHGVRISHEAVIRLLSVSAEHRPMAGLPPANAGGRVVPRQ